MSDERVGLLSEDLTPFREPDADVLPIVVDDSATAGTTSPPPVDLFGSYPTALGDSLSRSETDNDSGSRRRKRRRRGRVLSGDFDGDDTETISSDDGSVGNRPGRHRRRGSKGRSPRSRRRRQQRKRSGADVEEESEEPVHDEDQDESSSVVADMESGARKRCMLYPSTPFKNVLDAVVSVILLYILLVIPYRVSFDADSEGFFFVLEYAMDFVFVLDLVLAFRTPYQRKDGALVTSCGGIGWHYLRTWFLVDFLAVFPFDLVVLYLTPNADRNLLRLPKTLRLLRLMKLIRVVRALRMTTLYKKWAVSVGINSAIFRLMRLLLSVLAVTHLLACLFFLVASLQVDAHTWVTTLGIEDSPPLDQYLYSFYWALTTVTTVGYGDFHVETTPGRVYAIAGMIVGVTVFSYSVGAVSYLVQRLDSDETRRRLDAVSRWGKFRRAPLPLVTRIRQHFIYSYDRQRLSVEETKILRELSPSLKRLLAQHLHENVLLNNPLFEGCPIDAIAFLISALRPLSAAPEDIIYKAGMIGHELYVLVRGSVDVCSEDGEVYYTLQQGTFFGALSLVHEKPVRVETVTARTYCDLEVLDKKEIQKVLQRYPSAPINSVIVAVAKRRLAVMAQRHARPRISSMGDSPDGKWDSHDLSGSGGLSALATMAMMQAPAAAVRRRPVPQRFRRESISEAHMLREDVQLPTVQLLRNLRKKKRRRSAAAAAFDWDPDSAVTNDPNDVSGRGIGGNPSARRMSGTNLGRGDDGSGGGGGLLAGGGSAGGLPRKHINLVRVDTNERTSLQVGHDMSDFSQLVRAVAAALSLPEGTSVTRLVLAVTDAKVTLTARDGNWRLLDHGDIVHVYVDEDPTAVAQVLAADAEAKSPANSVPGSRAGSRAGSPRASVGDRDRDRIGSQAFDRSLGSSHGGTVG